MTGTDPVADMLRLASNAQVILEVGRRLGMGDDELAELERHIAVSVDNRSN